MKAHAMSPAGLRPRGAQRCATVRTQPYMAARVTITRSAALTPTSSPHNHGSSSKTTTCRAAARAALRWPTQARARDEYCSDRCYEIALAAADEAAENRYI
jgi:hypothetical protein